MLRAPARNPELDWIYGDPPFVIAALPQPLLPNHAHLVLIGHPDDGHGVEHVVPVSAQRWQTLDRPGRSTMLRELVDELPVTDETGVPRHSIITVISRPGLTVLGPAEMQWLIAWRYATLCGPSSPVSSCS